MPSFANMCVSKDSYIAKFLVIKDREMQSEDKRQKKMKGLKLG